MLMVMNRMGPLMAAPQKLTLAPGTIDGCTEKAKNISTDMQFNFPLF